MNWIELNMTRSIGPNYDEVLSNNTTLLLIKWHTRTFVNMPTDNAYLSKFHDSTQK